MKRYPPTDSGPSGGGGIRNAIRSAHCVVRYNGTAEPCAANELLHAQGYHGVMRLDEVASGGEDPDARHRQDRLQSVACDDRGEVEEACPELQLAAFRALRVPLLRSCSFHYPRKGIT